MIRILVIMVCLLLVFGSVSPVFAALPVEEAVLMPGGEPYEINPDGLGGLWISDWGLASETSGRVWWVKPGETSAVVYTVPGLPTDARREGDYFWWVDGGSGIIGRAEVGADGATSVAYSTWEIPGIPEVYTPVLYGSMIDESGRLWATDAYYEFFYRLTVGQDAISDVLCTYELPNLGGASYLAYKHPFLWIADNVNSILYRLDVTVDTSAFTSWTLLDISSPIGMAVDADGDLWYADYYLSALTELDPDWGTGEAKLSSYPIGSNLTALMVAVEGSRIWFTGDSSPVIGILNPSTAAHTDLVRTTMAGEFTRECMPLARTTDTLTRSSTNITWGAPSDYPLSYLASGLQIHQIPPGDLFDSSPWGIANQDGMMWVVDSGRQKLIKIPLPEDIIPSFVYLPLIQR